MKVERDKDHRYFVERVRVPGVNEMFDALGMRTTYPQSDALLRGQAFHQATVLHDQGTLNYTTLGARLLPYMDAYKAFLFEWRPKYMQTEQYVFHPELCYCGTPDRVGLLEEYDFIPDFKTSDYSVDRITDLQTAAYALAAYYPDEQRARKARRVALRFDSRSKYKAIEYKDNDRAIDAFKGLVALYKWKVAA
jgi:hypothetical protein